MYHKFRKYRVDFDLATNKNGRSFNTSVNCQVMLHHNSQNSGKNSCLWFFPGGPAKNEASFKKACASWCSIPASNRRPRPSFLWWLSHWLALRHSFISCLLFGGCWPLPPLLVSRFFTWKYGSTGQSSTGQNELLNTCKLFTYKRLFEMLQLQQNSGGQQRTMLHEMEPGRVKKMAKPRVSLSFD